MYQRKLEKDIRCPLEYGMELFGANGTPASSACWLRSALCATVSCAARWAT